jgi:hypothetical protein
MHSWMLNFEIDNVLVLLFLKSHYAYQYNITPILLISTWYSNVKTFALLMFPLFFLNFKRLTNTNLGCAHTM